MPPKKIHIATFGCQMNVDDSERMVRLMAGEGFEATDRPEEADLIVVNTCSVREKAEQKAYSLLGRFRRLKEARPELKIALTGCLAQQEGEALLARFDHLDLVAGTGAVNRLARLAGGEGRAVDVGLTDELPVFQAGAAVEEPDRPPVKSQVTIMQGCDNFCAYCVVPLLRGRERSRPPEEVLAECRAKVEAGTREINLLGQNVNSYSFGGWDFERLLRAVAGTPGLIRLRFTTSHPKDMGPGLIRAMGELENLAPFLHLPFQAGSDRILKLMNRGYTKAAYLELTDRLKAARPGLALSSDCIVGFPGETEEDFGETMDLIERVRFDSLYSFRYSNRPGTKAAGMGGQVPPEEAQARLARLQERQKRITFESNQALEGRVVEVLVEGPAKRGRLMTGRTGTNKVVNFPSGPELVGCLAEVIIERAGTNSLRGGRARSIFRKKTL